MCIVFMSLPFSYPYSALSPSPSSPSPYILGHGRGISRDIFSKGVPTLALSPAELAQQRKCCLEKITAKNLKLKTSTNDTTISARMNYARQVQTQSNICVIQYQPPPFL